MKRPRRPDRLTTLVLAALVMGSVLITYTPSAEAATTRALTISTASTHPANPLQKFDSHPPKLFDFNGDGRLEIIAQNDNRYVYVFDSQSGALLSEFSTRYPPGWGARSLNGPEAAVMNVGGVPHVIVANSAAYVTSFRFEPGSSGPGHFQFTKIWERRLNECGEPNPGMDSRPVLADLNNDGTFEILAYTEEVGGYALRMDGSLMWKSCIGGGNAAPAVADMNFDGIPEVVWPSDGGVVTVSNGATGRTQWTFWAGDPKFNIGAASIVVGATIGQIDGHGPLDIAFGARDSHDGTNFANDHAALFAVNGWGGLMWMRQDPGGAPLTHTLPIIHDVDGDGQADVLWADWNTIGHKPPAKEEDAWKRTGPAHFYRYDAAGNLRWKTTLDTFWNNKNLALADVDGDGVQEVLANGPGPGGDGIWYLDSRSGAKETFVSTAPWKVNRAPVLADLWNTGTMQWVVQVEAADGSVSGGAILVFDTHQRYNAAYPHPPYPSLGNAPPPPSGSFDATFTIKNPNTWWQEVAVTPDTPMGISDMRVRIDGGSWLPMSKSPWGPWTSSYHAAAGDRVEFQARSGGAVSQSAPFSWLDGTLSKRSVDGGAPPPGGGGEFQATFVVPSNVNAWWVEVETRSVQVVSRVTATVNGGAPVDLPATSWGTWAKSIAAPAGSQVRFTATSTTGATTQSDVINWLGSTPPPPPPGGGGLTASFALGNGINEWWVDVKVTSTSSITSVVAIVDGGSPVSLSKTSWGTWAKSIHVSPGSSVVFRASSGSQSVDSSPFSWLGSGGGGGAFDATFTVKGTDNNWWVEAHVTANKAVTSVDARVNGGAWQSLPKTSWGTWAKSFFVPDGATVEFRAKDASGATDQSGPYTWT